MLHIRDVETTRLELVSHMSDIRETEMTGLDLVNGSCIHVIHTHRDNMPRVGSIHISNICHTCVTQKRA